MKIKEYINGIISNEEFLSNSRNGFVLELGGVGAFEYKMQCFEKEHSCKLKPYEDTSLIYAKKYLESDVMVSILKAYGITDEVLADCNTLQEIETKIILAKMATPELLASNRLSGFDIASKIYQIEYAAFREATIKPRKERKNFIATIIKKLAK